MLTLIKRVLHNFLIRYLSNCTWCYCPDGWWLYITTENKKEKRKEKWAVNLELPSVSAKQVWFRDSWVKIARFFHMNCISENTGLTGANLTILSYDHMTFEFCKVMRSNEILQKGTFSTLEVITEHWSSLKLCKITVWGLLSVYDKFHWNCLLVKMLLIARAMFAFV